jgi:hypothetical protein
VLKVAGDKVTIGTACGALGSVFFTLPPCRVPASPGASKKFSVEKCPSRSISLRRHIRLSITLRRPT